MTARSVLLSALLGEAPASMPVRRLVRVASLFGINENQARVALSRMVSRGDVVVEGDGAYALTGRLLDRSRRLGRARSAGVEPFDGTWHVVVVTASGDDAGTRRLRRAVMRDARLGELREGVWTRPANFGLSIDGPFRDATTSFRATPADDPRTLARSVFDVGGWQRRAKRLCAELERNGRSRTGSLAAGFELNADVLRHLQRDPLLPEDLLDRDWLGTQLRERYEVFDERYRAELADAHRAMATGALTIPLASVPDVCSQTGPT